MRETGESSSVEIDGQRLVGGAEGVDTHIELPATEEERVEQVSLADVRLRRVIAIEGLPLADIRNLIEDKNALALTLRGLANKTGTGFMIHSVLLSFCVRLNSS